MLSLSTLLLFFGTLFVSDSLCLSTYKVHGAQPDNADQLDVVEPNFGQMNQPEVAASRRRQRLSRGLPDAEVPATPCGTPPPVQNGMFTLITVYISGDSSEKSHMLTYTCDEGHRLVGRSTLICSESTTKWDGRPPLCIRSSFGGSNSGSTLNTDCMSKPPPADVLNCFPELVIRYKYSIQSNKCERYLACSSSHVGFVTLQHCQNQCSNFMQTTTTTPRTTPTSFSMFSGGRRGPQCLPGVSLTHSSCLDDSTYLVATLPTDIQEVLDQHNIWRSIVYPPANPPIPRLQWDEELAISAERWAAQCQFAHNSASARKMIHKDWPWVGQNICAANYEETWTECITSWGAEARNWTYGIGANTENAVVGHYTQVIHAKTTHIGCGKAQCSSGPWRFILACNYGPGGNIGSQDQSPYAFPYNVTTAARTTRRRTTRTTPTTTTTTRPPPTLPYQQSGGRRGSQCLPGVLSTHTSCLPDSGNLVATIPFVYNEILDSHNKIRAEVYPPAASMPRLQWSEELAIIAERWAAQCRISHDSSFQRQILQWHWVGQNMRFSTTDRTWPETIDNWGSEKANFRFGLGAFPLNATVGHYTQIVWDKTTHVGCGRAFCRNIFWNYIYVCNYGPGGNIGVNGQSPYAKPYEASAGGFPPARTRRTRPPTFPTTPWWYTRETSTPRWYTSQRSTTLPQRGRLSGGLRGPQCFPDVVRWHASCLDDSPNLERTYRFNIEEVLHAHNEYRKNVTPPARHMPMLQYSDELAVMAERWAAQCPVGHDQSNTRETAEWPWVGQNICWKSGADETWGDCVHAWGAEKERWRYGVGAVPSSAIVGHYTQIIWADTLFIGCGKAKCRNTQWEYALVCNYGPGGNVGNGFSSPYATPYESA